MQSTPLALYLSTPFLGPRLRNCSPKPAAPSPSYSSSLQRQLQFGVISCRVVLCQDKSAFLHHARRHVLPSFLVPRNEEEEDNNVRDVTVRAASVPGSEDGSVKPSAAIRTLQLGAMFGIWYLLNIYFNIYNKQVLKVYPFPATMTAFQFGCGTVLILTMWASRLHPFPKLTWSQFNFILALAIAHTMGNLLTNISLGKVAVSFTHTIKAMEPFFTVVLAALLLGERPTFWVVSSLVPIVGGVALASFTEASFNWIGFSSAMASNLTNQSRNVFSKKFMVNKEEALDNINLFSLMTIMSFILVVPIAIYLEGIKFSPSYLRSAASQGLNVKELCVRSVLAGLCFHSYQQVSYMILQMVSPVTHSVGNSLKRVVVIVSSVIFFQTPISLMNSLGTAVALIGVFLYSGAKRMKPKLKSS